jgi:RNA polymerase sigma factor (sigma-70 family)
MKQGDADAFSEFVEFHMPLARQASRMLVRWFDMDRDDAEQTAMIGLIEAARRFDPERGFQFSTYAGYWIRQCCQRYGLEWGLQIRVPPHIFWRCYRLAFERTRMIATHGERDGLQEFDAFREREGISSKQWTSFWMACHVHFLSELSTVQTDRADSRQDSPVLDDAVSDEVCAEIQRSLKTLPGRQAEVLRLRYGIGGREHTLQEVAERLGITRERVRQIQIKAEEKLEKRVAAHGFAECVQSAVSDLAEIELEENSR